MTSKETKSVSLSPKNKAFLDNQDNASAVVDDLVTQLREGGDKSTAVVDMQIEQKKREIREAESRVERLTRGLEELQQLRGELQFTETAELENAKEALEGIPRDPTNEAVKNWAKKLGVSPAQLIEQLD